MACSASMIVKLKSIYLLFQERWLVIHVLKTALKNGYQWVRLATFNKAPLNVQFEQLMNKLVLAIISDFALKLSKHVF